MPDPSPALYRRRPIDLGNGRLSPESGIAWRLLAEARSVTTRQVQVVMECLEGVHRGEKWLYGLMAFAQAFEAARVEAPGEGDVRLREYEDARPVPKAVSSSVFG